jgi:hypothetical protein
MGDAYQLIVGTVTGATRPQPHPRSALILDHVSMVGRGKVTGTKHV